MRGFTLLETIISVTLIAILASLGWILSITYFRDQSLRAVGDSIVNELTFSQTEAIAQTDDVAHGVAVFADKVTRFEGSSYASRDPSQDHDTEFAGSITVSGVSEFVFPAGSGAPTAGGTLTIEQNNNLAIDIAVSPYGVVEVTERTIGP
jgi:prepilin-type N-terminal cleavage/methylation domain-containing protein